MRRLVLPTILIVSLVLLGITALVYASYRATWQRTYGAFPPFALELTIVDSTGMPVPQPLVQLHDATTHTAADTPFFAIEPQDGRANNPPEPITLRFRGQPAEIESWRVLWLFPRVIDGPRGFDSYLVAVSAPGHAPVEVALPALLSERTGTLPLPDDPTRTMVRYGARVTLP